MKNQSNLCLFVGPEIITPPQNKMLTAGEALELSCTVRNNPGATQVLTIVWLITTIDGPPRMNLVQDVEVTEVDLGNGMLKSTFRIEQAAASDCGVYRCHAFNREFSDAVTANATVNVSCECMFSDW